LLEEAGTKHKEVDGDSKVANLVVDRQLEVPGLQLQALLKSGP
jgi:hypothetical protein